MEIGTLQRTLEHYNASGLFHARTPSVETEQDASHLHGPISPRRMVSTFDANNLLVDMQICIFSGTTLLHRLDLDRDRGGIPRDLEI